LYTDGAMPDLRTHRPAGTPTVLFAMTAYFRMVLQNASRNSI